MRIYKLFEYAHLFNKQMVAHSIRCMFSLTCKYTYVEDCHSTIIYFICSLWLYEQYCTNQLLSAVQIKT